MTKLTTIFNEQRDFIIFTELAPLGRFSQRVAMSACLSGKGRWLAINLVDFLAGTGEQHNLNVTFLLTFCGLKICLSLTKYSLRHPFTLLHFQFLSLSPAQSL